jgi:hypothetical protein
MGIRSSGASILTSDSVLSGSLVIVNKPAGYTVTGAALKSDTSLKKSIITPGSIEVINDIGGGGNAPSISSLTVTDEFFVPSVSQFIDTVTGGYVEIIGTGFDVGAIAYLNGESLTTTRVDATKLRIVIPPTPAGAYSIMVFNSDSAGTIFSNINLSIAPSFITPAGSIGSFFEFSNVNFLIQANADSNVSYLLGSGTLPSGVNLIANGTITGIAPAIESNTNFSFVVTATDEEVQTSSRSFSLTVEPDVVTWLTPANNLIYPVLVSFPVDNVFISATSIIGSNISYSTTTLPAGLSIVAGNVIGTPTVKGISNTIITATSLISSKTANIVLQYKVLEPYILENYTTKLRGFLQFTNAAFNANITPGLSFDTSGGNVYFADNSALTNSIWQYSMTSAWDISTAQQYGRFNQTQDATPAGIAFKPDGTKFFMLGQAADETVFEYVLATPWDITTSTFVGQFSVNAQETSAQSVSFSDDGTKMFIFGLTGDDVTVYTLSTAWQANTASLAGTFVPSNKDILNAPTGMSFNSTGTRLYLSSRSGDAIYQYNISPAWDILASSNVVVAQYNFNPTNSHSILLADTFQIFIKPDGTSVFVLETAFDAVFEYTFGILDDISSIMPVPELMTFINKSGAPQATFESFFIKDDGTRIYVTGATADKVDEYSLSTPWEIKSGSFQGNSLIFSSREGSPNGLFFKSDGTKMYVVGSGFDAVNEFNLSTPWQANTASYVSNVIVLSQDGTAEDVFFKSDGTKMYVLGSSGDRVHEYNLSTAWQANSAVVVGNVSVQSIEPAPRGLTFNNDGSAMFIVGDAGKIHRFNLSTAWQANTAVANSNVTVDSTTSSPRSIKFGKNGSYMYVGGTGFNMGRTIRGYELQ